MRQFAAIFLLALFAFNIFGYKLLSGYFAEKADQKIGYTIAQNGFDTNELILVKKAVNLPYYNLSTNFETKEGTIEIDGTYYNFVKSRVVNDTLELLCLPNTEKNSVLRFEKQLDQYAGNEGDRSNDKSKLPLTNLEKKAAIDYDCITHSPLVKPSAISITYGITQVIACADMYALLPPKPPRV